MQNYRSCIFPSLSPDITALKMEDELSLQNMAEESPTESPTVIDDVIMLRTNYKKLLPEFDDDMSASPSEEISISASPSPSIEESESLSPSPSQPSPFPNPFNLLGRGDIYTTTDKPKDDEDTLQNAHNEMMVDKDGNILVQRVWGWMHEDANIKDDWFRNGRGRMRVSDKDVKKRK